jgi:hypothetical protein
VSGLVPVRIRRRLGTPCRKSEHPIGLSGHQGPIPAWPDSCDTSRCACPTKEVSCTLSIKWFFMVVWARIRNKRSLQAAPRSPGSPWRRIGTSEMVIPGGRRRTGTGSWLSTERPESQWIGSDEVIPWPLSVNSASSPGLTRRATEGSKQRCKPLASASPPPPGATWRPTPLKESPFPQRTGMRRHRPQAQANWDPEDP